MTDGLKINEHIYNHTLFGDNCRFSSFQAIEEFFAEVPTDVQSKWAYDFADEGYKTTYESADIISEQCGFAQSLNLVANISNSSDNFIISSNIKFDDEQMIITLNSLFQNQGSSGNGFSSRFIQKHQDFLMAYDQAHKIKKPHEYSKLLIDADSSASKQGITTIGGYVWANHGFDFQNDSELKNTRKKFKKFAEQQGVEIADKHLQSFTKPCHFAAFGCGVSVEKRGQTLHLGKAFMLEHSWLGKWSPHNDVAEEKCYAKAYASCPAQSQKRRQAVAALSSKYKILLKKYYKLYGGKPKSQSLKVYARVARIKFSRLMHSER